MANVNVTRMPLKRTLADRHRPAMLHRLEQRPSHQVVAAEEVGLPQVRPLCLRQPDRQQLTWVVPLVQRLGRLDAVVALQPDQSGPECLGQRLRRLGLADSGLAFQQDGLRQPDGTIERGRQSVVGQVADVVQLLAQGGDVGHQCIHTGARRG